MLAGLPIIVGARSMAVTLGSNLSIIIIKLYFLTMSSFFCFGAVRVIFSRDKYSNINTCMCKRLMLNYMY